MIRFFRHLVAGLCLFTSLSYTTLLESSEGAAKNPKGATTLKLIKYWTGLYSGYLKVYQGNYGNWFDEIELKREEYRESQLFLGALPILYGEIDHIKELTSIGVDSILSLVEPFEISPTVDWFYPVSQKNWADLRVKQALFETPDFQPVSLDLLEKSADYIHSELSRGSRLYVHCKSGKGRSASAVIAFFMKYLNMPFLDAKLYVSAQRPAVHLNRGQTNSLLEFERSLQTRRTSSGHVRVDADML